MIKRAALVLSMLGYLNFVTALHRSLGCDIPEADYPQLATVDGCVRYLSEALQGG